MFFTCVYSAKDGNTRMKKTCAYKQVFKVLRIVPKDLHRYRILIHRKKVIEL